LGASSDERKKSLFFCVVEFFEYVPKLVKVL